MSPHSDTLFWFRANQSLLLFLNDACLAEKQQIPILYRLWFDPTGARTHKLATIYRTRGEHANHYAADAVLYNTKLQFRLALATSCGTVALMVIGQFSDICGPSAAIATGMIYKNHIYLDPIYNRKNIDKYDFYENHASCYIYIYWLMLVGLLKTICNDSTLFRWHLVDIATKT